MKAVYLIHAQRTPIGKLNGALSDFRPDDLLSQLFSAHLKGISYDPLEIDDIIVGCANQAGEDNRNVGRMSAVLANIPFEVPATTINRLCGSSLDAVIDGWARIQSGLADCIWIGGVESMTRAPYALSKSGSSWGRDQKMYDTTFGWRFTNPKMEAMFPLLGMGETAEEVQKEYKISREDQDKFALSSHQKAVRAWNEGAFNEEVLKVSVQLKKELVTVEKDEGPRADTTLEKLAKLPAAFRKDGTVTAGNASMMNDGASMGVLVSESFLKKHNLTPIAEITGAGVRGLHPNVMGLGPIYAINTLCKKFGKKVSDFDVFELNEAFAVQVLASMKDLDIDPSKVNLNGGAISLGHPLGCSGMRILGTLAHIMKKNPQFKQGLASMCIGVGQGVAVSIKNCK